MGSSRAPGHPRFLGVWGGPAGFSCCDEGFAAAVILGHGPRQAHRTAALAGASNPFGAAIVLLGQAVSTVRVGPSLLWPQPLLSVPKGDVGARTSGAATSATTGPLLNLPVRDPGTSEVQAGLPADLGDPDDFSESPLIHLDLEEAAPQAGTGVTRGAPIDIEPQQPRRQAAVSRSGVDELLDAGVGAALLTPCLCRGCTHRALGCLGRSRCSMSRLHG